MGLHIERYCTKLMKSIDLISNQYSPVYPSVTCVNVSLRQFLLILIPRHDTGEGQGGETRFREPQILL